jgi:hypothetical protein
MSVIDKAYFTLEEIEERWQLPHRDVVYLAENGLLRLSVRLFDMRLEWGEFEDLGNGDWNRIPTDQRWFSGLQDLRERDAFRLFRDGEVAIGQFWRYFASDSPRIRVRSSHLPVALTA